MFEVVITTFNQLTKYQRIWVVEWLMWKAFHFHSTAISNYIKLLPSFLLSDDMCCGKIALNDLLHLPAISPPNWTIQKFPFRLNRCWTCELWINLSKKWHKLTAAKHCVSFIRACEKLITHFNPILAECNKVFTNAQFSAYRTFFLNTGALENCSGCWMAQCISIQRSWRSIYLWTAGKTQHYMHIL